MPKTWSAVLARIGTPTGDRRIIAPGALTSRDLPLPLMWQRVSGDGHGGAVTVGAIQSLTIDNESGMVTGSGTWLDVRGSGDAQRQAEAGVTGPSVDLFDDLDIIEVQRLVEAGVIGPDVTSNLDDLEYAMDDDGVVVITSARIAGATLVQIPAFAGVSITTGGGTEVSEPAASPLLASATVTRVLPPLEWFMKPDLDRVTPLTVSDTGRVFGHIAPWGSCHVGLPGCVTPPPSYSNYAYFLQSSQPLADGTEIPVGTLVAGPRHADAQLAFHAATQHYDDPKAAVAKVMAGEDEFGIWVAGWLLPNATEEAVDTFRTSPVSGDWRRIGGNLEMIAVCSVNSAGFPIPKARVAFSNGAQQTLIGSFGITPVREVPLKELRIPTEDGAKAAQAKWAWYSAKGR